MESEREAFEMALMEDPYDKVTRSIYADWLEEKGLDSEAQEERRKATDKWVYAAQDVEETAKKLLYTGMLGLEEAMEEVKKTGHFYCNSEEIYENGRFMKLLRDWSIYTGESISLEDATDMGFSCGC